MEYVSREVLTLFVVRNRFVLLLSKNLRGRIKIGLFFCRFFCLSELYEL